MVFRSWTVIKSIFVHLGLGWLKVLSQQSSLFTYSHLFWRKNRIVTFCEWRFPSSDLTYLTPNYISESMLNLYCLSISVLIYNLGR